MPGDDDLRQSVIEAHQDLVARIEQSVSRIRALSLTTIVVALFLSASYVVQLVLPLFGVRTVTVNLTNPANEAVELVVLALAAAWFYIGVTNILFLRRVGPRITSARLRESELQKKIVPDAASKQ